MAEKRAAGSPEAYRFTFLVFRDKDPVLYERLKQAPSRGKSEVVLALVRKALAPPRRRGESKEDQEHQAALAALQAETERLRLAAERMERLIASLPAGCGALGLGPPPVAAVTPEVPTHLSEPVVTTAAPATAPAPSAHDAPDAEPELSPEVLQRMREMAGAFD